MANVVVVYHSGYGHTQFIAQAVAQGADAQLLPIDADGNLPEGGWDTLANADAIVFGIRFMPTPLPTGIALPNCRRRPRVWRSICDGVSGAARHWPRFKKPAASRNGVLATA